MFSIGTMSWACSDDGAPAMTTVGSTTTSDSADDATSTDPAGDSSGENGSTSDEASSGELTTATATATASATDTDATTSGDDSTGSSGTTGGSASAVVYLNFEGVELAQGAADDAATNTTQISELAGTWSAIDAGRAATVLAGIEALYAPFAIDVTDARPAAGPYTMVVVAAGAPPFPGAGGLALSDCDDMNPSNVAVVFDDPVAAYSTQQLINIAGFQIGVTHGLNPVEGSDDDMMTSVLGEEERSFTAACATETDIAGCTPATATCDAGEQSSLEEMLARFGPS